MEHIEEERIEERIEETEEETIERINKLRLLLSMNKNRGKLFMLIKSDLKNSNLKAINAAIYTLVMVIIICTIILVINL